MKTPHIANNEKVIEDYVTALELLDLKETSIITRVQSLVPFFKYLEYKIANDITKSDIEKYITYMRRSKKKKVTQNRDIINIRAFFNWRKPENDYFNNIKIKREKPDNSKKEFVDASDVLKMLPHCTNQRDRVLLMLMWESGARLGELLSINIEDVKPHKHGITVTVTGKTGKRDILIIDSVPDIQQWLNIYKADKGAPLFPIMSRRGKGRLGSRGAEYVISNLAEKAGLEKRVYCHSFRHGRLSELSNAGMSEMQLRHYAGWTDESDMPAVYLHTTQDDVFNKLLKIKGVDIEEMKTEPVKVMSKKVCPRCKAENAFDSLYCHSCSMILDPIKAQEVKEEEEDLLFNKFYDKMQNMLDDSFEEVVGKEKPKTPKNKRVVSKK